MRLVAQVFAGYCVLLLLGATWRLFPFTWFQPDLVVLWAAYIGLTARKELAPSLVAALSLGYLADLLFGLPSGLLSLVCGLVCVVCHVLQGRLLIRGHLYVVVFSFAVGVFAQTIVLLARAKGGLLPLGAGAELRTALVAAFMTALFGPLLFRLARHVDSRFARTRRDRAAAASGLLI